MMAPAPTEKPKQELVLIDEDIPVSAVLLLVERAALEGYARGRRDQGWFTYQAFREKYKSNRQYPTPKLWMQDQIKKLQARSDRDLLSDRDNLDNL